MANVVNGTSALREVTYIKANNEVSAKIRVAAYARVSTDSDDQLESFISQVRHYTKLIENDENYEMVEIYADEGISGVSLNKRTEFLRMIEDARNLKIDKIITKSLSRFSRNYLDCIILLRELKSLGVTVVFEKEGINTDKLTSENLLSLYSLLSEQESTSISQNVKKSHRARMSNGEFVLSNAPYGYNLVNRKLEIYEPEAKVVRRIFKEYISGYGFLSIAHRLEDENIPKKSGSHKWDKQAVEFIICNEKYVGDMILQKTYNEDTVPYKKQKNCGELPKYHIKQSHEPIVDVLVYEIAKIILESQRKKRENSAEPTEYMLSKKIKCGLCGTTFRRKCDGEKVYWICMKKDLRYSDCSSERLTETEIYIAFINMYNKLIRHYKSLLFPMLESLEQIEDTIYKDNSELKKINNEIFKLSEQNHLMSGLMTEGILSSALFISKTDEINKQITKLKKSKSVIIKNRNSNEFIKKTEELIEVLEENSGYITEMNEEIFNDIVDKIVTTDEGMLNFHLVNGLILKERIEK